MTVLYSGNFDSETTGSIAAGWTAKVGTWAVGTNQPVSGAKSFEATSAANHDYVQYTALAAQGDTKFQLDYINLGQDQSYVPMARMNSAGTSGYLWNVAHQSGGIYGFSIYRLDAGTFTLISTNATGATATVGDVVHLEILCNGSTIEGRLWLNAGARPSTPTQTVTDTTYATGQVGVLFGHATNRGAQGFDNALLQDLAAGATATSLSGPTSGSVGVASANFTVGANGGITGTVVVTPSDSGGGGTFSPATVSINTASPTGTFTYTPGSAGAKTISTTNNGSLTNPTSITYTASGTSVTIARANAALRYSPSNWADDGTSRMAWNPGAYVKFAFTGTSLSLNTTALGTLTNYPIVRAYIDDQQYEVTLTNGGTSFALASGLPAGTHNAYIFLRASDDGSGGYWALTNALKIVSFTLDASATVSALTARSKVAYFFGDSITNGCLATGSTIPANSDALAAFPALMAEAFDCEYGQIGANAANFAVAGSAGVPQFNTSYTSIASGFTRMSGATFATQPDYIFVMLGQNGSTAQSDVATAISNLRTAAPSAYIFFIVNAGGFGRAAVTAAVTAAADTKIKTIDAGTAYAVGLYNTVSPSYTSFDGIHYKSLTHARLSTKWGSQVATALVSSATFPTAAQVLAGIAFGPTNNLTGNVTQPTAAQVLAGVTFGAASGTTGTVVQPTAGQVQSGVSFGPSSTLTGTYTGSSGGTFPTASQVLSGVTFGPTANLTGNVVQPTAAQVQSGVTFGPSSSLTGTYASGGATTITGVAIRSASVAILSNGQVIPLV